MSTVDVIVPCYNYAHFLEECVESVLSQSYRDLRVLIINDASRDNTDEVAQKLLRRDSRVQYLRHLVNRGHIATYNEGLEWAAGEYTQLLSADDMLTPGSLARSVELMDAHPEVVLTHGQRRVINPGQPIPILSDVDTWESTIAKGLDFINLTCERGGNFVNTPTVIVRTDVQKRIGGYRADLPHSADMEMWLRFAVPGPPGYIHVPQAYYRKHDSNMHYAYLDARDLEEQWSTFSTLFDAHGHLIPNAEELRNLAARRIAEKAFWSAYHAFDRGEPEICAAFVRFAIATDPRIRSWRAYRRMRLKLSFGSKWWSRIQRLANLAASRWTSDSSRPTNPDMRVGPQDERRKPAISSRIG